MSDPSDQSKQSRPTTAATGETDTHTKNQADIASRIARRERRHLRARQQSHRQVWFGLGMFGLIGWSVAIPTVLGAALGMWLDARWNGPQSWTLTLLVGGLVMGCLNAWRWVREESEVKDD